MKRLSNHPPCYRFIVEADPCVDALVRILAPFMVQGARLESVEHQACEGSATTRIRASDLAPETARLIATRLDGLTVVRSVGFGW
jgi:hypothetical protein